MELQASMDKEYIYECTKQLNFTLNNNLFCVKQNYQFACTKQCSIFLSIVQITIKIIQFYKLKITIKLILFKWFSN